jgi:hypothetical protein
MRELVLSQLSGATPESAAGAPKLKLRWRLQLAESIDSDLDAPAPPQTDRSTYRDAEGVAKILQTQARYRHRSDPYVCQSRYGRYVESDTRRSGTRGTGLLSFRGDVRPRERFMVRQLGRSHTSAPLNATLFISFQLLFSHAARHACPRAHR